MMGIIAVDLDIELRPVLDGPEMISGVRASSMRMESTSSTIAKAVAALHHLGAAYFMLSRR
jgi:hypothetical protein